MNLATVSINTQGPRRSVCSSSAPCKCEKICVNFHGLKQEQRCVLCFETCIVIRKSYLAELLFLAHSSSGFSGSFTAMRRKDIRLKKRNFICQSTAGKLVASPVKTLLSNRMARCAVRPTSHLWCTSGAEKPMEACVWCMRPASAVVVPALCASSVNGRVAPLLSRAR